MRPPRHLQNTQDEKNFCDEWNPEDYRKKGTELGVDENIVSAATSQISAIRLKCESRPSLLTLKHLSVRTGVPYKHLRKIVCRNTDPYRTISISKRAGGKRIISIPDPGLKRVQKWIARYILNPTPVHSCSHAFSRGASIKTCAKQHRNAKWLLKIDIKDFFHSISERDVYHVFTSFGYQPLVAFELSRLCTRVYPATAPRYTLKRWQSYRYPNRIAAYEDRRVGHLPQGAPTSPMLANLASQKMDERMAALSNTFRVRYTRYADDMHFSSDKRDFGRQNCKELLRKASIIMCKCGFTLSRSKTIISPPGSRKIVLGLVVDGFSIRLPRERKDALRQHLYYLENPNIGPIGHAKSRGFDTVWGLKNYLSGLIDFAEYIEPSYGRELRRRFLDLDWPL